MSTAQLIDTNYNHLQSSIDKVVGKIGLTRTIQLLDSFIGQTTIGSDSLKINTVNQYLASLAVEAFDLEVSSLYTSSVTEYRDARMCCFHLLKKYTKQSYPKIGIAFKCGERPVMYGVAKVTERLEAPQGYREFIKCYEFMESRLIEFLGKLK